MQTKTTFAYTELPHHCRITKNRAQIYEKAARTSKSKEVGAGASAREARSSQTRNRNYLLVVETSAIFSFRCGNREPLPIMQEPTEKSSLHG